MWYGIAMLLICSIGHASGLTVEGCGQSAIEVPRIVGGKKVKHGEFPWMVTIHELLDENLEHVCGGSILNEHWIVTAAHCVEPKPELYEIYVGLHKLSVKYAHGVRSHTIAKIVLHQYYDNKTYNNDIALLKTTRPIDIEGSKGYRNGICLPTSDNDPVDHAKVIGWGHTIEDGENSETLMEVAVPMIPRDLCNESYDDDPYDGNDQVNENMICAGMAGRDSCQNDSGGPLFQTDTKGVSTLIGIVSHGIGCGQENFPGVYTKISKYRVWITENISK